MTHGWQWRPTLMNYKVWEKGEDESDAGTVREGSPEEAAETFVRQNLDEDDGAQYEVNVRAEGSSKVSTVCVEITIETYYGSDVIHEREQPEKSEEDEE